MAAKSKGDMTIVMKMMKNGEKHKIMKSQLKKSEETLNKVLKKLIFMERKRDSFNFLVLV